jgi:hypothetical protein
MKIELKKFGDLLISRPAGREAALAALAYLTKDKNITKIEVDFDGVLALAPSFIHEFVNVLSESLPHVTFEYLPSQNTSVNESLKFL